MLSGVNQVEFRTPELEQSRYSKGKMKRIFFNG